MKLELLQMETERMFLTGITPENMSQIFEHHQEEDIKTLLGHQSEEDYQKEKSKYLKGYAAYNRTFLLFLLKEKKNNQVIGRCGLHNWNTDHYRAEIGYHMVVEEYKRQGYMSEAVSKVLEYGFTDLKLHRIEAQVGKSNTPSLKIMEKFNFIKEGLLRENYWIDQHYEDSIMFSLLTHEYVAFKM